MDTKELLWILDNGSTTRYFSKTDRQDRSRRELLDMIKAGVDETLKGVREIQMTVAMKNDLDLGLAKVKRAIFSAATTSCPTTLIVLPDLDENSDSNFRLRLADLKKLFSAVKSPVGAMKAAIQEACRKKYRIALLCEVCLTPQTGGPYPATVSEPSRDLAPLVAFADASLKVLKVVNFGANAAKLFLPFVPSLSAETLKEGEEMIKEINSSTLDGFPELKRNVAEACVDRASGAACDSGDYCHRQLEAFLNSVDPTKHYGGLNKVMGEDGMVYFVCGNCKENYDKPEAKR